MHESFARAAYQPRTNPARLALGTVFYYDLTHPPVNLFRVKCARGGERIAYRRNT